jgi:putative ABC transport system permease protein
MVRYYIHIAFRHFSKNLVYPVFSIVCLVIGVAISLLAFVYLTNELAYDRFHKNAENIYRVVSYFKGPDQEIRGSSVRAPVGPAIKELFPEVRHMTRLSNWNQGYLFYPKENSSPTDGILFADTSLFSVLSFQLIQGIKETCLSEPNSIVLTENLARTWFGNENPMGKQVRSNKNIFFTITGIVKDPPSNSHIRFKLLLPLSILINDPTIYKQWNGGLDCYTYIQLEPGTDVAKLEEKFKPMMWEKENKEMSASGFTETLFLQPLLGIHLNSETDYDLSPKGNKTALRVLVIIGLAVLILGCINFFNLSTVQTISRIKDVAVRKVHGANSINLIIQYLTEALLLSFSSVFIGIAFAELALPLFNHLAGTQLGIQYSVRVILFCMAVGLFPGLFIGIAASIRFFKFNAGSVFQRKIRASAGFPLTRDILVVVQFVVSLCLLICTEIMAGQVDYLLNKDLGFDKKNISVISLSSSVQKFSGSFRDEVLKLQGVRRASSVTELPGFGFTMNGYKPEGAQNIRMWNVLGADKYFFETMRIPLIAGRMFNDDEPVDQRAFIINESLAQQLGWNDPVGKMIERNGQHNVLGVVKDFHFASLHEKIMPLIIAPVPTSDAGPANFLLVSYETKNLQAVLKNIQSIWEKIEPKEPFNSYFLDEHFASLYEKEMHQRDLFRVFSMLAFLMAVLGLFSMSIFSLAFRTKEIGIRKVNGAGMLTILKMLIFNVQKKVVIAFFFAAPISWYLMKSWLQQFIFREELSWLTFFNAFILAMVIADLTILWQCYKAARNNPVDSLRYE